MLITKVDEPGRPAWAFAAFPEFRLSWPLGLLALACLACTRRLLAWPGAFGRWSNSRGQMPGAAGDRWQGWTRSSGNQAFDDYRAETLRHLEEERREFQAYLDRLRRARDKAEFDEFMAERRKQPAREPPSALGLGSTPTDA